MHPGDKKGDLTGLILDAYLLAFCLLLRQRSDRGYKGNQDSRWHWACVGHDGLDASLVGGLRDRLHI